MRDIVDAVLRMRECSRVERAHTTPHHGSYTVGQHSFDMMTLAYELMPHVTRNVLLAIMFHDFSERWTGDVPSPMKCEYPELGMRLARIEGGIIASMGWQVELTDDEREWIRALDVLEFYLWSWDQLMMGNQRMHPIIQRLLVWFATNTVPEPIATFVSGYRWAHAADIPK